MDVAHTPAPLTPIFREPSTPPTRARRRRPAAGHRHPSVENPLLSPPPDVRRATPHPFPGHDAATLLQKKHRPPPSPFFLPPRPTRLEAPRRAAPLLTPPPIYLLPIFDHQSLSSHAPIRPEHRRRPPSHSERCLHAFFGQ
jgi:hypothetical protein